MTSGSSSLGAVGFWSYAHADNESESGRIVDLATDVRNEFRLLSGADLELFLDRDALKWGQDWRAEVDQALAGVTFFIPVMTPTFFQREECRREVRTFVEGATSLGVSELILPILYADVPGFGSGAEDEVVRSVAPFQYEDWRDLRLEDRASPLIARGFTRSRSGSWKSLRRSALGPSNRERAMREHALPRSRRLLLRHLESPRATRTCPTRMPLD